MRPLTTCRLGAAALVLLVIAASGASAYEQPLSPEAVREAYFLGRHHEQAAAILGRYTRTLNSANQEFNISKVQLLTPYAQIVRQSLVDMLNENSVDIDQEYPAHVLPVIVRVWFYLPASKSSFHAFDKLVRHTSIVVSQSHSVKPKSTSYTTQTLWVGKYHWPDGVEVQLTFSDGQFSSSPLRIAITSPGGHRAETSFDLSSLK
jgi:hypothetical protein